MLLQEQVPSAVVRATVGRRGAFEVNLEGTMIHSKLQTGGFPDRMEVLDIVKHVSTGGEPRRVVRSVKTCQIL